MKETSAYRIAEAGVETGDVICRMVVRDLTADTPGNFSGIYTRVYPVFFFEAKWAENFATYIVFSTIMMHLTVFPLCPSWTSPRLSAQSSPSPSQRLPFSSNSLHGASHGRVLRPPSASSSCSRST